MINADHPMYKFCYGEDSILDCKKVLEVYKDHAKEAFRSLNDPLIQASIEDIGRSIGVQSKEVFKLLPVQRTFSLSRTLNEMFKYEPNDEILAKEIASIKVVDIIKSKEPSVEISYMPIFYQMRMHQNFDIAYSREHGVHKIMLDRIPHVVEYSIYLQTHKKCNIEVTKEQRTDEFVFKAGREINMLGYYDVMHSQYVSDLGTRISAGPVTLFATEDSLAMKVFNQTFR